MNKQYMKWVQNSKVLFDNESKTAIAKRGDNVSTVQRTEAKATEVDSGIVTCDHKMPNEHAPFSYLSVG